MSLHSNVHCLTFDSLPYPPPPHPTPRFVVPFPTFSWFFRNYFNILTSRRIPNHPYKSKAFLGHLRFMKCILTEQSHHLLPVQCTYMYIYTVHILLPETIIHVRVYHYTPSVCLQLELLLHVHDASLSLCSLAVSTFV